MVARYWPDEYINKRRTAKAALNTLRAGQRVFVAPRAVSPSIWYKRWLTPGSASQTSKL